MAQVGADAVASPKHPKAGWFRRQGLLDQVANFTALEDRIGRLPTERERGDAFEVFAEAYLAAQPIHQVSEIWPLPAAPPSLRQRVGLARRDMGVDGLFKALDGQISAYQVKFRSTRSTLPWKSLGTFMGLSDRVTQRVLVTNCNAPDVMRERRAFYCISGMDLDRLDAAAFDRIRGWLGGQYIAVARRQPHPHQRQALDAILLALKTQDRVTAVMACGTGKTLVALWTAEQLACKRVLVLVPSLALLRQTLHQWLEQTRWSRPSHLCVCSDPTVTVNPESDQLALRPSELDFPVTTDAAAVRRFFGRARGEVSIVFATYHSVRVVGAGMPSGYAFDVGLFDEAHRTAGSEAGKLAFALDNQKLAIRKRVFLTATPRHFDVRKRSRGGEHRQIYSMDDARTYGEKVYTLSFARAVEHDIVCPYKVVISVITQKTVTNELIRRGVVFRDGDRVKARQVANQLAIIDAVARHGITKIFTFHGRVRAAKSFTKGQHGDGIGAYLYGFQTFHVNGQMAAKDREDHLREFSGSSRAIMSNARCLSEGVDVPAVDMVAFLAPKRSTIDIVQATGRAMRRSEGKTTGYVLVPVLVEEAAGETIEDALTRSTFDQVWTVLQAMQEQDEVLADIIREMGEERGRTRGFDDSRFRERVEVLCPDLPLELLRRAISTECLEQLGVTWDERYGQLQAYKERFGDCYVPQLWRDNKQLGAWVGTQRGERGRDRLSPERINRLDGVGFIWDVTDARWEEMYTALRAYKDTHGDCNVSSSSRAYRRLGSWVADLREGKKKGTLSAAWVERLEAVGLVWEPFKNAWEKMYSKLAEYRSRYGDCNVLGEWPDDPELGSWVADQRKKGKRGHLRPERAHRLDALGFEWDPLAATWDRGYAELVKFKNQHGHCNVPINWSGNKQLANFVRTQRVHRKRRWLSKEQTQRLDRLGFSWERSGDAWDEMFLVLSDYKRRQGHCNVPLLYDENPKLGHWIMHQRVAKREERVSDDRIKRLNDLGFSWDPYAEAWNRRFAALVKYKTEHGHCNVPKRDPKHGQLGRWVSEQRVAKRRGELSEARMVQLDRIGFEWEGARSRNA
jgi:superfamily II DNA or RNA helicase